MITINLQSYAWCKGDTKKVVKESDIADFVKKADFDDKLKNVNKKITSDTSKHVLVENELHELS